MQPAAKPPGDAQPDWYWPRHVAAAMGFNRGMGFTSSAEIYDEFVATTAGRPDDQSGLSHELLARDGPQQWPYPAGGPGQAWRYTDHVFPTPTGRARFLARAPVEPDESPSPDFPLLLTTGRLPNQWHTPHQDRAGRRAEQGQPRAVSVDPPARCRGVENPRRPARDHPRSRRGHRRRSSPAWT